VSDPEQARAAQIRNIEAKTGLSMPDLQAEALASGHAKHGALRTWAMERFGLGYGDANALAAAALASAAPAPATDDPLATIYAGKKAHLRPVHDRVIAEAQALGEFEIAPKKGYVSLRRKKQFATLGPKNSTQVELGFNLKDDVGSDRIVPLKPGGMCQFAALLSEPADVDDEVRAVLRAAFLAAG